MNAPAPFIVGMSRSGSTLLRLMLDAHPLLAIPAETHFIPEVAAACRGAADPASAFLETVRRHPRWSHWKLDDAALARALTGSTDAGAALRAFYGLCAARSGKPRWGDKTPAYVRHMTRIESLLPEARFVHLIRDGRDVARSVLGVPFGPRTLEGAAKEWKARIRAARRQAPRLRHYLEVRYEDLVLAPARTLRRICDFLELTWDDALLRHHLRAADRLADLDAVEFARGGRPRRITREAALAIHGAAAGPPDPERVQSWRGRMTAAEHVRFEAAAGDLLRELGYD